MATPPPRRAAGGQEPVDAASFSRSQSVIPNSNAAHARSSVQQSASFSLFRSSRTDEADAARIDHDREEQRSRLAQLFRDAPQSVRHPPRRRANPPRGGAASNAQVAAHKEQSKTLPPAPRSLPPLFVAAESSGEDQRRQVMRWASDFSRHSTAVMPSTMAVSTMYSQLVANTSHLPQPSSLRVAASFWMLGRICASLEVNSDVISRLVDDVRQGLFMPSLEQGSRPREEFRAAHLEALGLDPQCGIHDLLSNKPYFESHEELSTRVARLQARLDRSAGMRASQVAVLDICRRRWQRVIVSATFRAWRGAVRSQRLQSQAVAQFAARYDRRDRLQTHFYAWRFVVVGAAAERAKQQAAEGVDALVVTEARTNTRVEELGDQAEEMRMKIARLRSEKLAWSEERATVMKSLEAHVARTENWRALAVTALQFLGELKGHVLSVNMVSGKDMAPAMEVATTAVLGWARELVHGIPAGAKLKVNNFGSDMRDGAVYVVLLHAINPDGMSLENLAHKEARRRFEVALDAMTAMNLRPPFRADDLLSGATDAHFANLYTLWWHFCQPPTPSPDTCLAQPGSFRDDYIATNEYLAACREHYPQWLQNRAILAQLAIYVLQCRARGAPAKVVAADEEKLALKELAHFAIEPGRKVPDVFLELAFMTAHHRQLNDEERERVNHRVLMHLGLLRPVYLFYAGGKGSSNAAGDASSPESPKAGQSPKKGKHEFERMDFVAFYHFCEDCKLIGAAEDENFNPALSSFDSNSATLPKLTKPQCYALFMDTYERFALPVGKESKQASKRAGMRDAHLTPASWVAACLRIAVMRHASWALPLNTTPAPAAQAFEQFLATSVAPFACASSASAFDQEFWSTGMQDLLAKKRKVLIPFFEHYAGLDGNGTMDFGELVEGLNAIGGIDTLGVEEAVVRRTFAHLTGASEADPTVRASASPTGAPAEKAEIDEGVVGVELRSEGEDTDDDEEDEQPAMVYGEFETLLVTLAVYAEPAPHISLQKKTARLLDPVCTAVAADLKRIAKQAKAEAL